MKTCPYCGSDFPEREFRCPECGKLFWEPDLPEAVKKKESIPDDEKGCFSLFLVPLFTAVLVIIGVLLLGFLLNLVIRFEEKQEAILWVGLSFLISFLVYQIRQKIKSKKKSLE